MTPQEKYLYHEAHPLKLLTDWGAGLAALYFFWKQELRAAVLLAVVPPLVVFGILIRFASLERYATSKRGEYIKAHMTRARELLAPCRICRHGVRGLVPPSLADPVGTLGDRPRLVCGDEFKPTTRA